MAQTDNREGHIVEVGLALIVADGIAIDKVVASVMKVVRKRCLLALRTRLASVGSRPMDDYEAELYVQWKNGFVEKDGTG